MLQDVVYAACERANGAADTVWDGFVVDQLTSGAVLLVGDAEYGTRGL